VSEQQPNPSLETTESKHEIASGISDFRTIVFMVILSFICALILSVLASALAVPKEIAKDLDRSKQMLIASKILSHDGHFLIKNDEGRYVPAKYLKDGILVPGTNNNTASQKELLDVYKLRLQPLLVDDRGNLTTFKAAHLNEEEYLANYKKSGYYLQPFKLIYKIMPNPSPEAKMVEGEEAADGYVIPVSGFGLWDAIYGYLAIKTDGNTIIGTTWYDQKETPGLGANIADPPWQSLFPDKVIFQPGSDGKTDFQSAPLGITVVKGKVSEVLGETPKAKNAVDGMAGATLTGYGVTDAYKNVLNAYRPFLLKLHDAFMKNQSGIHSKSDKEEAK
jgi:Na+-transporting NADH:ubiquinone oxidoreductase subunit C